MKSSPNNASFRSTRLRKRRAGTTVVETAFVMPFFIFFLYMVLEVSHMLVVNSTVKSAARGAARFGTTSVSNTTDTKAMAVNYCSSVCYEDKIQVWIKDASGFDDGSADITDPAVRDGLQEVELADLDPNSLFLVQVRIDYNDILFIPWPFTQNVQLEGRAFMRRE